MHPTSAPSQSFDFDFAEEPVHRFYRGIDPRPVGVVAEEVLPTPPMLMALDPERRIDVIWDSGVKPDTAEMAEVFRSVADVPGRGQFIGASIQTGLPPSAQFHRREGRLDTLVWPDGYPLASPRRMKRRDVSPLLRRPTKAEQLALRRALEAESSLFPTLPCGCLGDCVGSEIHRLQEAAQLEFEKEEELRQTAFLNLLVSKTMGLE